MSITSEEAGRIEFAGTAESYDRSEVEDFRRRVIEALSEYENETAADSANELAEAQRIRQQAVQLTERMLREVIGSSGDTATGGVDAWQDAVMLRALAEEEMEFAREEARRLPAMALAERDQIRAESVDERKALRRDLQEEAAAFLTEAEEEADRIRRAAEAEAADVLSRAVGRAQQAHQEVNNDLRRGERRLAILRTALADAESRFRRLAATAANEAGTLAALADQDVRPAADVADMQVTVDLTDAGLRSVEESAPVAESPINRDEEAGFYQRRLAGLRDRLEKSGHPPE